MVVNAFLCAFLGLAVLVSAVRGAVTRRRGPQLRALLDEIWEFELREDPLYATQVGDHRYDDRLPVGRDVGPRAAQRCAPEVSRAAEGDRPGGARRDGARQPGLQRVKLEDSIREFELHHYRFPINADSGFHMELAQLTSQMPFDTPRDYENFLARLHALPEYMAQNTELLRDGLKAGWTLPKQALTGYEKTIEAHVVADPDEEPILRAVRVVPGRRARGRSRAARLRRGEVDPRRVSFRRIASSWSS